MNWWYRRLHRFVFVLVALGLFVADTGVALDLPQQPANYVVDLADVVDTRTESRLNV